MEGDNRPTLKIADLPALRDIYRYSASMADEELALTTRRYEQTLERRDKLRERIRFGLLALNATSLAAVFGSLGSKWVTKFGITDSDIAQTMTLFIIGLMAGASAIWWSGITATKDAANDFENLLEVRARKAEYDAAATVEAEQKLLSRTLPESKIPPDYRWSKIDNILTNFAGGFWLYAVGSIAWKVANQIEWHLWCS